MANMCDFKMRVVGEKRENIETFYNMLNQKGTTYMGRGGESIMEDISESDGVYSTMIEGWCKWSIRASLVLDAISMRNHPERWTFGNTVKMDTLKFLTLYEACEKLELDVEVYSSEPGCEFQEHVLCRHGEVEIDDCVSYTEEYDEESDEYITTGGYEVWDFEI